MTTITVKPGKTVMLYYANGKRISRARAAAIEQQNCEETLRDMFVTYERESGAIPTATEFLGGRPNFDVYCVQIWGQFPSLLATDSRRLGAGYIRGYRTLVDALNAVRYVETVQDRITGVEVHKGLTSLYQCRFYHGGKIVMTDKRSPAIICGKASIQLEI